MNSPSPSEKLAWLMQWDPDPKDRRNVLSFHDFLVRNNYLTYDQIYRIESLYARHNHLAERELIRVGKIGNKDKKITRHEKHLLDQHLEWKRTNGSVDSRLDRQRDEEISVRGIKSGVN